VIDRSAKWACHAASMAVDHQSVMSVAHPTHRTRSKLPPGSTNSMVAVLLVSSISACGANWWKRAAATPQRGSGGTNHGSIGMSLRKCVDITSAAGSLRKTRDETLLPVYHGSAGSAGLAPNSTQKQRAIDSVSAVLSEQRAVYSIGTGLDGLPPNGQRISRAATVDRNNVRARPDTKITPILGPHSGVGLHARVIRIELLPRVGSCEQRARRLLFLLRCEMGALAGPSAWASRRGP
jgi:hypothetical protein